MVLPESKVSSFLSLNHSVLLLFPCQYITIIFVNGWLSIIFLHINITFYNINIFASVDFHFHLFAFNHSIMSNSLQILFLMVNFFPILHFCLCSFISVFLIVILPLFFCAILKTSFLPFGFSVVFFLSILFSSYPYLHVILLLNYPIFLVFSLSFITA